MSKRQAFTSRFKVKNVCTVKTSHTSFQSHIFINYFNIHYLSTYICTFHFSKKLNPEAARKTIHMIFSMFELQQTVQLLSINVLQRRYQSCRNNKLRYILVGHKLHLNSSEYVQKYFGNLLLTEHVQSAAKFQ